MSAIGALDVTDVDISERLERIKKSTGYWCVNIRSTKFEEYKIDSTERCWDIIEKCRVFSNYPGSMIPFRWGYPVINSSERDSGDYWIQSGYDGLDGKKIWRFHQSGQFIDYFTCFEDDHLGLELGFELKLDIFSTLYRITEIYEFATRLALKGIFDTGVKVTINLTGMEGRRLIERRNIKPDVTGVTIQDDINSIYFSNYISSSNEINIKSNLNSINFIASSREEALNKAMEIYSKFGLNDYPEFILREKQDDFLKRRL
ncbi:MAG: hypothetical protein AAB116_09910 [Candidatus Poribacteria bacterium]